MSNAVQGDMFATEQPKKPKKAKKELKPYLRRKPFMCKKCGYYVKYRRHYTNMDWRRTVEWQCMNDECKKKFQVVGELVPKEFRL